MKVLLHYAILLIAIIYSGNAEADGCAFDQVFIGQIKRALQSSINNNVKILHGEKVSFVPTSKYESEPIHGFRVLATESLPLRGYFLALPGNAQRADSLIENINSISEFGYDVLAVDYRGLLKGSSVPTIESLIDDTRSLIIYLNVDPRYKKSRHVLYGISSGGIFALQALDILKPGDLVILDAVPDKLSFFLFCDSSIHPKNALDAFRSAEVSVDIINGKYDNKVVPYNSRFLIANVEAHGGTAVVLPHGAHPYESGDDIQERLAMIRTLLER